MTDSFINVLLIILMHYADGLYRVYEAVPFRLLIGHGKTATRHVFEQNQSSSNQMEGTAFLKQRVVERGSVPGAAS